MLSSESSDDEENVRHQPFVEKNIVPTSSNAQVNTISLDPSLIHKKRKDLSQEELLQVKELRKERKKQKKIFKQQEKAASVVKSSPTASGRKYTMSMALPGSIVDNAQSKELKSYLAGQIARAAAIFQIDEIIIFNDKLSSAGVDETAEKRSYETHRFLSRILQYLETPQYLRKSLFPVHQDLKYAGLLNPLDCPHHMRLDEWSDYREGVVVPRPIKVTSKGSWVNVGLGKDCQIDKELQPGVRVTVKLDPSTKTFKKVSGWAVPPSDPRVMNGLYWGYTTRIVSSIRKVWEECPFEDGYDLKIGTSERGHVTIDDSKFSLPTFKHGLIVFGGVHGIEECVNADEELSLTSDESHTLFDIWVNTCPHQGSRTIRTEEAILISLAGLRPHIQKNK